MVTTVEQLFSELLASEPARPFVTYYDEAAGTRDELSAKSLANWVAKTHHLLIDELGLGAGDRAFLALPAHWISVPALLGCCTAGLAFSSEPAGAEVAFIADATAAAAAGVPDVFAVSSASAATGFGDAPPAGTRDYVSAVRPQADRWTGVQFGASAGDRGLDNQSRSELAARAAGRAAELGLAAGARVLCTREWSGPADWIDTLLAPLAVGGSVVYVRHADAATLARRASQERVSARID